MKSPKEKARIKKFESDLLLLLSNVLQDCSTCCGTTTTRDLITISRRVEKEGVSFLMITLGDFCQDFERSLDEGSIASTSFRSFKKNGLIPKLFSGMTRLVFNNDGRLLSQPSIKAIFCIRQVCRMWKKIEFPCSEERNRAAIDGYAKIESELSMFSFDNVDAGFMADFDYVSGVLWSSVLGHMDKTISSGDLFPRHGNGATSLKVFQNQKYDWREWHQRLEPYFPSDAFCYNNSEAFLEECSKIAYLSPEQERPVRVVFVPKTLKTPRVIGIEPACMQYTQQSLMSEIVQSLETHALTKGHVNFTDQTINARLALTNSKTGYLATMDMKEASDRVHHALVYRMLRSVPVLRDAIFACRSARATLPNCTTMQLEKFASMGSALCFPIESMVFYTILLTTEYRRLGLPRKSRYLSPKAIIALCKGSVFVYGDDLLLPVDMVPTARLNLEALCLKVNTHKSFATGKFRESCGMDAYDGVDVTSIYVRRMLPTSRRDVSGIVSAVKLCNALYSKEFYKSSDFIRKVISRNGLNLPIVAATSPLLGYVRDEKLTQHRYNEKLHRPEVKGLAVVVRDEPDIIDGRPALMKWFLQGASRSKNNYTRSVGSGNLTVKPRWSAVHSYGVADYVPKHNQWSRV